MTDTVSEPIDVVLPGAEQWATPAPVTAPSAMQQELRAVLFDVVDRALVRVYPGGGTAAFWRASAARLLVPMTLAAQRDTGEGLGDDGSRTAARLSEWADLLSTQPKHVQVLVAQLLIDDGSWADELRGWNATMARLGMNPAEASSVFGLVQLAAEDRRRILS